MTKGTPLQEIEKALISRGSGSTIQQIMTTTRLARGTVKAYLDELINIGRVHEEEYGQNTKVFFLNGRGEFQRQIQMGQTKGILFVDVMTDPWKRPFIRVKFRNNQKDIGAIFLNNEESVDKLIEALNHIKPQLKKYTSLIKKLEPPIQE